MVEIIIKSYNVQDVYDGNKVLFNVNNIWVNDIPSDYKEIIAKTYTNNWIYLINPNTICLIINLNKYKWLFEACKIGTLTGNIPKSYSDEFTALEKDYKDLFPMSDIGWFIRSDYNSPKYGCHGTGPYKSIKMIAESIVTTKCTHRVIEEDNEECRLYFLPWIRDFDIDREFRVFVKNNKITGVSVQYIYKRNEWISNMTDEDKIRILNSLIRYFNSNLRDTFAFLNSYVMDIYMIDEDNWYFIEPNPFGAEYSSGSGLFHWINDYSQLNDTSLNKLEFRYTA